MYNKYPVNRNWLMGYFHILGGFPQYTNKLRYKHFLEKYNNLIRVEKMAIYHDSFFSGYACNKYALSIEERNNAAYAVRPYITGFTAIWNLYD